MKAALFGASALQFWRSSNLPEKTIGNRVSLPDGFIPSLSPSEMLYMNERYGLVSPVDIVVDHDRNRRSGKTLSCHVCSISATEKMFVHVGKNLYVSSPEHMIMQVASTLRKTDKPYPHPFAKEIVLATLITELAGAYRLMPSSADGFRPAPPLLDLPLLTELADRAKSPGCESVRRAIDYAAAGSNSPAETQLFLFECLPKSWGGMGFDQPTLNKKIKTKAGNKEKERYGDQCWERERIIVEYNGGYHEGERANSDDERRNELAAKGYYVIVVNKKQLHNAELLDSALQKLADSVAASGRRTHDFVSRRATMRGIVFETCGTKCADASSAQIPQCIVARGYGMTQ